MSLAALSHAIHGTANPTKQQDEAEELNKSSHSFHSANSQEAAPILTDTIKVSAKIMAALNQHLPMLSTNQTYVPLLGKSANTQGLLTAKCNESYTSAGSGFLGETPSVKRALLFSEAAFLVLAPGRRPSWFFWNVSSAIPFTPLHQRMKVINTHGASQGQDCGFQFNELLPLHELVRVTFSTEFEKSVVEAVNADSIVHRTLHPSRKLRSIDISLDRYNACFPVAVPHVTFPVTLIVNDSVGHQLASIKTTRGTQTASMMATAKSFPNAYIVGSTIRVSVNGMEVEQIRKCCTETFVEKIIPDDFSLKQKLFPAPPRKKHDKRKDVAAKDAVVIEEEDVEDDEPPTTDDDTVLLVLTRGGPLLGAEATFVAKIVSCTVVRRSKFWALLEGDVGKLKGTTGDHGRVSFIDTA